MGHKFRSSERFVFACKENQKRLAKLKGTMNGYELAKKFRCTPSAVYQALKKLETPEAMTEETEVTTHSYKAYRVMEDLEKCPINKGAEICQELGYKHNTDYISQHGLDSFKQNIKPRIKKALA